MLKIKKPDYNAYAPKKFFPEIEIAAGPNFLFPGVDSAYWDVDLKRKVGYTIGLGLTFTINKNFEISTRFLRERKGFKGSYGMTIQSNDPPSQISGREVFNVSYARSD